MYITVRTVSRAFTSNLVSRRNCRSLSTLPSRTTEKNASMVWPPAPHVVPDVVAFGTVGDLASAEGGDRVRRVLSAALRGVDHPFSPRNCPDPPPAAASVLRFPDESAAAAAEVVRGPRSPRCAASKCPPWWPRLNMDENVGATSEYPESEPGLVTSSGASRDLVTSAPPWCTMASLVVGAWRFHSLRWRRFIVSEVLVLMMTLLVFPACSAR